LRRRATVYARGLVLDYKKAEKGNKARRQERPPWEPKLATLAGGAYKAWHDLWVGGQYNAFADKVAAFQIDLDLPEKSIDGILGSQTWASPRRDGRGNGRHGKPHLVEVGDHLHGRERRTHQARLQARHGQNVELPEDKSASEFNVILPSISQPLATCPRNTAALVLRERSYASLGEFVSESDIWAGKLEPAAVLQAWGSRDAYDLMRAGRKARPALRRQDAFIIPGKCGRIPRVL